MFAPGDPDSRMVSEFSEKRAGGACGADEGGGHVADDGDQHLGGEAEDGGQGGGGGHDLLPKDLLNKDQQSVGGVTVRRCMGNVNFYR